MLALIVIGSAHLIPTSRLIGRVNLRWHWRTLLIVRIFFNFWIDSVVRLQFLVVAIESWTVDALALLSYLGLRLVCVYLTEVIILFEAVWQVLRIKVVTLLIRFINCAIALILRVRQIDDFLLVNVRTVFRIFTLIIR